MQKVIKRAIKIILISIIAILMFCNFGSKAKDIGIASNYYEFDYDNEIISRIEPETTVEELKTKLNPGKSHETSDEKVKEFRNKIKIYEDKNCQKEITEGFIGTGMALKFENNIFELSVVGDFNKDGKATQLELSKIIRYIVGLNGTDLQGLEYESADITGDGQVNQIDITKYIRYIVFGELDLGKQDTTPPELTLYALIQKSNYMRLKVYAQDYESGMGEDVEYTFYLKKSSEPDSSFVEVQKGPKDILDLENLEDDIKYYYIKVVACDKAGNQGETYMEALTPKVPDGIDEGAIVFGDVIWENGMARTTISTDILIEDYGDDAIETDDTYQIEYQVNGTNGHWIKGEKAILGVDTIVTGLKNNDILYARLTDGTNSGTFVFKTIIEETKADVTPPEIQITLKEGTTEITAIANATDSESGIDSNAIYKFYIKKSGEDDSKYQEIQSTTNKTCTFTGLEQDTDYIIKVEVEDKAGNKGIEEISGTTKKIPDGTEAGSIIFSNLTWINGQAEVEITTNTNYIIEYQVNGTTSTWTKAAGAGQSIKATKLNHNDVIYARLTDGTGSGNYTTLTIVDTISPKVELQLQAQNQTIEATANATDNETGIDGNAIYNFYIKETGADDSTYVLKQNTTQKTLSISNLTVGKSYTIKVEVEDKAGNKGIQEKSILIPDDVKPVVDLVVIDKKTDTATVEASATDEGGLPNPTIYVFYIKETGKDDSTYKEIQNSANNQCTFTGLEQNKDYTVKVEVADIAGNIGVKEMSLLTEQIPDATQAGAINFTLIKWVNGQAEVEITTNTNYTIEYQVNGTTSTWTKGQGAGQKVTATKLNNGDVIYARLTDGTNSSNYATLTIADTNKPTVELNATSSTTSEITVVANAIDNETGIDSNAVYTFYIKEKGGTYVQKQNTTSKNCTFTGLEQNKNYMIKVEVEDKAGNKGIKEISTKTESIPDGVQSGAISFSAVKWNNGKAEVNIKTNTNYIIEYQVNGTIGTWTKASGAGQSVKVTNLNHNDIIYARLTDGTNAGNYTTLTILDDKKPNSFTISVTDIKASSFKVSGSTTDNETGIASYTYVIEDLKGNKTEYANITETNYEITGLEETTTYKVYMLAYDKAGNVIQSNIDTIITEKKSATGLVKYDAGDWTYEEIFGTSGLNEQKLYDINIEKTYNKTYKLKDESGLNFTFGGFTYKGNTTNSDEINSGTIITSRNQSVAGESGAGIPNYDGWQILECKEKNGKMYVTKLTHAGSPENFVCMKSTLNDSLRAEYILSNGEELTKYSTLRTGETINPRNWDMYKDKELDTKGYIKEVHVMTCSEAINITNNVNENESIRKTGKAYWVPKYNGGGSDVFYVNVLGGVRQFSKEYNIGIRPVIELNNGVYISSGSGTASDPYVLGKD